MAYLSVENFWKYQNADVWKKAKGHPPWFKHYVHRDPELDKLPPATRLLFFELLAAATRYSNVLEDDLNWLYAETRVEPKLIREGLRDLLKGGWLSHTKTKRRSRNVSRKTRDDPLALAEAEAEKDLDKGRSEATPPTHDTASLNGLPISHEHHVLRLLDWAWQHSDPGTEKVVRALANGLPEGCLARIRESTRTAKPRDRAKWLVGALKDERSRHEQQAEKIPL